MSLHIANDNTFSVSCRDYFKRYWNDSPIKFSTFGFKLPFYIDPHSLEIPTYSGIGEEICSYDSQGYYCENKRIRLGKDSKSDGWLHFMRR